MSRKNERREPCPKSTADLLCPVGDRDCTRCGWNPEVAQWRSREINQRIILKVAFKEETENG